MKVIKRNGQIVDFNFNKIEDAIILAMKSVHNLDIPLAQTITAQVIHQLETREDSVGVEEIQDLVEDILMSSSPKVAKEYILYREKRKEDRMIDKKKKFIDQYKKAKNASTGSQFDANANVDKKNIATLSGELYKRENILLNRKLLFDKIVELYDYETAKQYIKDLESHTLYKHDETSISPYCVAISMAPFLEEGLQTLGGISSPPTHLQAFCGSFINLVFAVSSQFAGAVATPEFLLYMDYFLKKDFGDDYFDNANKTIDLSKRGRTIDKVIEDSFQQVVYSMNQPAAARSFQSIFWNIGYFDRYYFEGVFGGFMFPDKTKPTWESINWLQKKFMKWFNKERTKKVLTFPVETVALLTENGDIKDKEYKDFISEMYAEGHSFFTYISDSADSLSSCCRLRSEVNDFSFSLGAGGVATGSKSVMTLNLNRLIQDAVKNGQDISEAVRAKTKQIHKYQTAYNEIIKEYFTAGLLPTYDAGFITLEKQYLTIGLNGIVESAEFLGIEPIADNPEYEKHVQSILKPIYEENKKVKQESDDLMFNTEFVPAENLGVKNARWDKDDGYFVPRDCYNSYFYRPDDDSINVIDKFKLHGEQFVKYLDGGSANHVNLQEHLSKQQYSMLLEVAARTGCNYFTFNVPNTVCNDCATISKKRLFKCGKCGSSNVDHITRIIGYLKRVSAFSEARQEEEGRRHYANEIS